MSKPYSEDPPQPDDDGPPNQEDSKAAGHAMLKLAERLRDALERYEKKLGR